MAIKIYKPKEAGYHESVAERFTADELSQHGMVLTSEADADYIICSWLKELLPFVAKHGTNKKYVVWCDEPLWTNVENRPHLVHPRYYFTADNSLHEGQVPGSIPIEFMNCYTGDVFFSNHHFLTKEYLLDRSCLTELAQPRRSVFTDNLSGDKKKIVALQTYRNGSLWNFKSDFLGTLSLCNLRSIIALEGAALGLVDVYGQGWPIAGLSKSESRFSDNRWEIKKDIIKNYFFVLSFENCVVHNYVTEKIWHAIAAGALPIYYGGPGHTIYRDFPKDSFIDYTDFMDPVSCWEFVHNMKADEFHRRLRVCQEVLANAINLSNEGELPRKLQLCALAGRLSAGLSIKA